MRHARKAIEHARKQDKARNKVGKAIKHIMNKIKQRVQIVAKKLHLHPLNLKSKVLRPKRGKRVQEHYLWIVEKREELKIFLMCLGEDLERRRERVCPRNYQKLPKIFFFFFKKNLSEGVKDCALDPILWVLGQTHVNG